MRKWWLRLAVLVAAVAAFMVLRLTVWAPQPIPVEVYTVTAGRVEETLTNSRAGTVKARIRARLSPEFGGQAVELPFREGDRVQAGDVVLRLDDSLQQARLQLAGRELEAAEAQENQACLASERAARELARMERLAAEQIVSTDLLDGVQNAAETSGAACEAAGAGVGRARAQVDLVRVEVDKTVLRAPFDALVAEVSIEVGEWTTPSPPALPVPPVIDLLDPRSIYIGAPMDEVDSARIFKGQKVRVTVDSHRGRDLAGMVAKVAVYVLDLEAQNRTVEIEVELEDAEFAATLLPGTSADVEVILEVHDDVLRIPTAALYEGSQALVVVDGRLEDRDLTVGLRNWDFTEILDGLAAGELVVTSLDRPEIRVGAEVEVADVDRTEDT